jgi:hypothetical protein
MTRRIVVIILVALPLLLSGISAQAQSTSTWDYPTTVVGKCHPDANSGCFFVPEGAQQAEITIVDDHSTHVTGAYLLYCGDVPGECPGRVDPVAFCDTIVVDLPSDALILNFWWDDPSAAAYDTYVEPAGCASPQAFGTTGTITVEWS